MTLGTHSAPRISPSTTLQFKRPRRLLAGIAAIAVCAVLGSCAQQLGTYNDFDTAGGIPKKDYEGLLGRRAPAPEARGDEPPIPNFQSVLAAPSAPELADTRRVSIAVTETTPVRDILIELARRAQVDLELDPRISGGVIMTATDRPFIEVIQRLTDLAELRYKFERNTLRVEIDDPYLEQYRMDILNVSRQSNSSASSSSDASSIAQAVGTGGGGGGNNQSTTNVTSQTNADFWGTIGGNIDQILRGIQSRRGGAGSSGDVRATFVPSPTATAPAAAPASGGAAAGGPGAPSPANALNQAAALSNGDRQAELDANIAADERVPEEGLRLQGGGGGGGGGVAVISQYSLNAQAGIITLFATQRQHVAVARYLKDVRDSLNQQVLIEAKVLEVTLSDQYRAGVDWNAVFGPNNPTRQLNINSNFTRSVVPPEFTGPTIAASWANGCFPVSPACAIATGDLSIAVQLVKEFGAVRTLSSPRLTVLNNQMAQLKVAQNQVFFQLTVNVTDGTATTAAKTTVNSQIKTIPIGLIMSVMPSVDPVSKRISLSLRPSITRITGYINDPGVAVTIAVAQNTNTNVPNVSSPIPIVEAREMDSLISMESGQTVVMGGLMQENVQTVREGIPGLMDIPLLGQALAENIKQNKVTELVVFIRATLANATGTVADEDIRLYRTFAPDPRPVAF